jgi:hypothetical protein
MAINRMSVGRDSRNQNGLLVSDMAATRIVAEMAAVGMAI